MSGQRPGQSQKRRNYAVKRKKKLTRNGILLIFILFAGTVIGIFFAILAFS